LERTVEEEIFQNPKTHIHSKNPCLELYVVTKEEEAEERVKQEGEKGRGEVMGVEERK